jgi:hypothetical protein
MWKAFATVTTFIGLLVVWLYTHSYGVMARDYLVYFASRFQNMDRYKRPNEAKKLQHSFVVALTTSPKRLQQGIDQGLFALPEDHYKAIVLSLPRKFRDQEEYSMDSLEDLQQKLPKLKIQWLDTDLGPQTKLLGAIRSPFVNPNDYIVVLDDDVLYANTLLEAYDSGIIQHGSNHVYSAKVESIYGIQITPGFASFCIQRRHITKDFEESVHHYAKCSKYCKRHDDFLFGATFQDLGLSAKHVKVPGPLSLPIGFGSDALHTQELSATKHYKCSQAIWTSRNMCAMSFSTNEMLQYF